MGEPRVEKGVMCVRRASRKNASCMGCRRVSAGVSERTREHIMMGGGQCDTSDYASEAVDYGTARGMKRLRTAFIQLWLTFIRRGAGA